MGSFSSQTAAQHDAEDKRLLEAARQEFPGWDFHPVLSGWEAVPAGTPVVRSVDLEGVIEKLRNRES
jgi:hypothetical protein